MKPIKTTIRVCVGAKLSIGNYEQLQPMYEIVEEFDGEVDETEKAAELRKKLSPLFKEEYDRVKAFKEKYNQQ